MLKIRLAQFGARNRRTYRIVVIEEGKRRNGKPVENLGLFNPLVSPPQISIDRERITYWNTQGAIMSARVKKLLSQTA